MIRMHNPNEGMFWVDGAFGRSKMTNACSPRWLTSIMVSQAVISATVRGQCSFDWRSGQEFPGIYGGSASALTTWDPDGLGPRSELVVVGGFFDGVGGTTALHIACWDGVTWEALGASPNARVHALTSYKGSLIAAGNFTSVGGVPMNYIASWDGSSWQPLGSGINGQVFALTVYNDELIAGGWFTSAGGSFANNIARWDGTNWYPLSIGTQNGSVSALTVYDGKLIVGGGFTAAGGIPAKYLASWNGVMWAGIGGGMNSYVSALIVSNNELIAGGNFTLAGGTSATRVARWDGNNWYALGSGMNLGVYTLTHYRDEIIAGGAFTSADGVATNFVAGWSGTNWSALDGGLSRDSPVQSVDEMVVFQDTLVVAGLFASAGGQAAYSLASWDGFSWRCLASGVCDDVFDPVSALTVWNGQLFAGGLSGGVPTNDGIAWWDGVAWQSVGSGVQCDTQCFSPESAAVMAFGVYGGELIAGGEFSFADGKPAKRIARWDGTRWASLGGGFLGCRTNTDCAPGVYTLTVFLGELIAGGNFLQADDVAAKAIARWDGAVWKTLGPGIEGYVYALAKFHDELIVGGSFAEIGGVPMNNIARWDGTVWSPLVTGIGLDYESVDALVVYDGKLVAAGGFSFAGDVLANNVVTWDGAAWAPLGAGTDYAVKTLTIYNGELIAAGTCPFPEEGPTNCITRWDGVQWIPLGEGVNGPQYPTPSVHALTVYDGELIAGGGFLSAGGKPSAGVARWGSTRLRGDANADGYVGMPDVGMWQTCLGAPSVVGSPAMASPECLCVLNADGDGDIDLFDFATFQKDFGE